MSEYQYYEFLAIDHPLNESNRADLRAISSRAQITATSFTNTYNWGDLKGDPRSMLLKWFDAFVYVANWGSHEFSMRLPRRALDGDLLSEYSGVLEKSGDHILVELRADEIEAEGWEEGEGWMGSLVPLRADLLAGDTRCLYLGWLLAVYSGELGEDEVSPPVPAGLASLSGPLAALVEFLAIDTDLVSAAAKWSAPLDETPSDAEEFATWLCALPESEKNALLRRIAEEEHETHLRAELLARFRKERQSQTHGRSARDTAAPRLPTAGELLQDAEKMTAEREKKEAETRRKEEEKKARDAAAKRKKHLAALAAREPAAWDEVESLIGTKQLPKYDAAVTLLKDLHELSVGQNDASCFLERIRAIRELHCRKPAFIRRLDDADLPGA